MPSKKAPAAAGPKRRSASGDKRAKPIRPRMPVCTSDQQAAMALFLDFLQATAESTRQTYAAVARQQKNKTIDGTLAYWQNAVSVLKWANTLNLQRKPVHGPNHHLRAE